MRRILSLVTAALLVALMPISASAQEIEFEAELGALEDAVEALAGEDVAEWTEAAAAVQAAFDELAGVADLDTAGFEAALAGLDAAIEGGDLAEIEAAAALLAPEAEALRAEAAEAAEGADDGTEEPAAVDTGSGVNYGPNVALLAVASLLALSAAGVWTLRVRADRG